ncbi:MAG: sodium:proton antiporter [Planctomycetota bacterium]
MGIHVRLVPFLVLAFALPASASGASGLGSTLPVWTVAPFVALLFAIAFLPLIAHHWWEKNSNKAVIALLLGAAAVGILIDRGAPGISALAHSGKEYLAFIMLLAALYIISGGIYVGGSLSGTPLMNTGVLAIGAVLASFLGTTGASVLLIRPLLRANAKRLKKAHIVVFFIFIVSNAGGLLTPLGDPPLYLGFLRGVRFTWTLGLVWEWVFVVGALLIVFHLWDEAVFNKEERERPGSQLEEVQQHEPMAIQGYVNVLFLAGVVAAAFCGGYYGPKLGWTEDQQKYGQVGAMGGLAILSLVMTPAGLRAKNRFTAGPIVEVAVLFAGIFATMVPALLILEARGSALHVTEPWQFFWATGTLSSFLDNAPTYLTFTSAASGLLHTNGSHLNELLGVAGGEAILRAISCGAVFMGANTYIGNGPNFMVKAIAEEAGVKMPSFVGFMAYSALVLIPIFIGVTLVFFR